MIDFLSNIPAGTILTCILGIGAGLAVVLAVTIYKCAIRPLARRFHH